MDSVNVGLISNDQFFRQGLKALLSEDGYDVTGSVSDHRELTAAVAEDTMPAIVLVDLARELEKAADQLRFLSNNFPGVMIVGFSDESDTNWMSICDDYEVCALLKKQVSFKALLHCLELVLMGEKVMPAGYERSSREKCESARPCAHDHHARVQAKRPQGQVIPCMTCSRPFETEDRRANRICSSCKSRISRVSGATEHTLHY
jgi:DNA-binding NarL/FixJ family response regulator